MTDDVFHWLAGDIARPAEECKALFSGWSVEYHLEREERAAAALCRGTEIHFVVAPEWRRRLIRRDNARVFLARLFAQASGMLTTRVLHGSAGAIDFIERIGFEQTWSDGTFHYYALCKPPFTRDPKDTSK